MKIKKTINESIIETELVEAVITEAEESPEEDVVIDDMLSASVSDIADAVQAAAEEASDGKETYSDEKAEKIATELKTIAKGFDTATWAPLDVANALTDALVMLLDTPTPYVTWPLLESNK